jgi:1,4-alpha-glucan branching enzyme
MFKKKSVKDGSARKRNYKRITFKFHAPDAQSVLLAGDFNSWNPEMHPLKKSSTGLWKKMVSLSPGRYEYRFVVDGEWQNDPDCTTCSPNPFGGNNNVLILQQ